jgi:23S rRNA pseudouridine2457 synthase
VGTARRKLRYVLFNKPDGVLCQFTDAMHPSNREGRKTLADYGPFPRDVYPVGRLDFDSEGLVLLTNDGPLKHRLLDPKFSHPRTYLVQVERIPSGESLEKLRHGVIIEERRTLPAKARLLTDEPDVPPRSMPIRFRKSVPTAWLELTLHEGKNRQVRKMTAAVGHPTLRLVRIGIANLFVGDLRPGEKRELAPDEITGLRNYATPL